MTFARVSVSLMAIVVTVILLYGLGGHGHEMSIDDGIACAVAAACLLIVTVLGNTPVPKPGAHAGPLVTDRFLARAQAHPRLSPDRRARASPSSLQRFRN